MDLFTQTMSPAEIVGLPGFAEAVELYLTPPPRLSLSGWAALNAYLARDVVGSRTERVGVLYLDKRHRLIADEVTGEGTVDHAPMYPREIIRRALELGASGLILTHNHPGGDPTPSSQDVAATRAIVDAARLFGIVLLDHVVTGGGSVASMKSSGLI